MYDWQMQACKLLYYFIFFPKSQNESRNYFVTIYVASLAYIVNRIDNKRSYLKMWMESVVTYGCRRCLAGMSENLCS